MTVWRLGGGSGGSEGCVAGALPSGGGLAHAHGDEMHELVLTLRKQRASAIDLVGGSRSLELVDAELGGEQQHRRGASSVDLDQSVGLRRERAVRSFEIPAPHPEVGIDEQEVGDRQSDRT